MHIYTAHVRSGPTGTEADLALVREGFCWPAALFPLIWALWHRMWIVGLLLAAAALAAGAALQAWPLGDDAVLLGSVTAAVLLGLLGNDLRRWSLGRAGWQEAGVVGGSDRDAAAHRLFDANPDLLTSPPPVARQPLRGGDWDSSWPSALGPRLGQRADDAGWRTRPGH